MRERKVAVVIRAKTPLRIGFGGGGTDISPYREEYGGAVLNATIDKYCYCTLVPRDDDMVSITSLDLGTSTVCKVGETPKDGDQLRLIAAAVKEVNVDTGCSLFLHTEAPPGTGLGSSSSATVAVIGALEHWMGVSSSAYDLAELAYRIEREIVGIKGGKQDQYVAAFGGFNFIEFQGEQVIVNPLRIDGATLNELEYRLVLYYTGKKRPSAGIIDDQLTRVNSKDENTIGALHATKMLAFEMKNALLRNRIDEFGRLLHEAWLAKKRFSPRVTDPDIDDLYETARQHGAIGGKLLGAGGGGYLLLLCQFEQRHAMIAKLEERGGKYVPFAFCAKGLQTWQVMEQ